jgi:hypothetical protein
MTDTIDTFDFAEIQLPDPSPLDFSTPSLPVFHHVEIDAAPAFGSVADVDVPATDAPTVDNGQADAPADDADQPDDGDAGFTELPFDLIGTDGSDRFEFSAGYGEQYSIQDFGDGDKIVLDGKHFGIDHVVLGELSALDNPADANVFFDQATGAVTIGDATGDAMAVLSGGEFDENGLLPMLKAADFVVV